jgi:hypothetical protein
MQAIYEWQMQNPPPEGLVSVVFRMQNDEARALMDGAEPADPIAQAVWQALRTAENTGALVLPS